MKKYCIIILIVYMNSSCTKDLEIVTFEESVKMYSKPLSGLVFRSAPSKDSKSLGIIPFNTAVECNLRTTSELIIDGKSGFWYNCNYKNKIGWLFGAHLNEGMSFDPRKTNYYKSGANDAADIDFILYKNKEFIIKLTKFPSPEDSVQEKKFDDYTEYKGQWEMQDNDVILHFSSPANNPSQLFESGSGKNRIEKLSKQSFIMRGDLSELYIWGGLCDLVRTE